MQSRLTFAEFLATHPDIVWIFLHVAWGVAYGLIIVTVYVVGQASHMLLADKSHLKSHLVIMQSLWALLQLVLVFGMPIALGLINREIFVGGRYLIWAAIAFLLSLAINGWFLKSLLLATKNTHAR
jgi:hypothetical protein